MTTLLKCMGLGTLRRAEVKNPVTLFEPIATLRSILRTVAMELNLQPNWVRLPSDTPPVLLGRVKGRIQVTAVPVAYWILPMLDGIDARRLGICDACQRLYWPDVAISWAVRASAVTPYTCGVTATPNTEIEYAQW
jgi:hypothetical protein